jgi:hypothetical protein
MRMTIMSSWTQTFNAWMKWNSIKDSYASINFTPQANTLFEKVQILNFALG